MSEELKPCPFCGSKDLKHYFTSATGGNKRGVIVCKNCGCRLEYYSDYVHSIADAYCGDWKAADEYAKEDARIEIANKWNRRAAIDDD